MEEVAKEMTVSVGSIANWLSKYNIVKHNNLFSNNEKWKGDMKT